MGRMMAMAAAAALVMASQAALAEGNRTVGGRGLAASPSGTPGRSSTDGMTSTGSGSLRSGGIGVGAGQPSRVTGLANDGTYRSGPTFKLTGGKGRGTDSAESKVPVVRMLGGVGTESTSTGGRGL